MCWPRGSAHRLALRLGGARKQHGAHRVDTSGLRTEKPSLLRPSTGRGGRHSPSRLPRPADSRVTRRLARRRRRCCLALTVPSSCLGSNADALAKITSVRSPGVPTALLRKPSRARGTPPGRHTPHSRHNSGAPCRCPPRPRRRRPRRRGGTVSRQNGTPAQTQPTCQRTRR